MPRALSLALPPTEWRWARDSVIDRIQRGSSGPRCGAVGATGRAIPWARDRVSRETAQECGRQRRPLPAGEVSRPRTGATARGPVWPIELVARSCVRFLIHRPERRPTRGFGSARGGLWKTPVDDGEHDRRHRRPLARLRPRHRRRFSGFRPRSWTPGRLRRLLAALRNGGRRAGKPADRIRSARRGIEPTGLGISLSASPRASLRGQLDERPRAPW